ncbi:protein gp37 [Salinibacter ruber]|nr:protein gp37 [Salinibacter ruber]
MSDLFHPGVDFEFIDKVFASMALAGDHIFQILTKRPERMAEYMGRERLSERWAESATERFSRSLDSTEPLENVWLGTSVEDEEATDRIDDLRSITAAVRFLSLEPLLGPLPDLSLKGIDWVIVGGESGNQARPMKEEWVRDIRDQCQESDVPFFFKQWGGRHSKEGGRELDKEEWNQMPRGVGTVPA